MIKKILLGLLILFLLSQFFQPAKNSGAIAAATDITHVVPVPDSIERILKISCYDCHSNGTRYPWYSRITPVNWWLKNHVDDGKRELNFSIFSTYSYKRKMKKLEEIAEEVEHHNMPLPSYLWIHKDADLNDAQQKILIDWALAGKEKVLRDSLAAL